MSAGAVMVSQELSELVRSGGPVGQLRCQLAAGRRCRRLYDLGCVDARWTSAALPDRPGCLRRAGDRPGKQSIDPCAQAYQTPSGRRARAVARYR